MWAGWGNPNRHVSGHNRCPWGNCCHECTRGCCSVLGDSNIYVLGLVPAVPAAVPADVVPAAVAVPAAVVVPADAVPAAVAIPADVVPAADGVPAAGVSPAAASWEQFSTGQ